MNSEMVTVSGAELFLLAFKTLLSLMQLAAWVIGVLLLWKIYRQAVKEEKKQ